MRHPTPQAATHAVGVIPARYQSSRFPGKPLALIGGRTLVERVFERARAASRIARLLVATDDDRIASAVRAFGDRLVECLDDDPSSNMATLADPLLDPEEARDPNIVKVVCDASGRALYFSRSPIPHVLAGTERPWLRHVGLYAYRRGFLLEFASWSPGVLERLEGLEQLRTLERGHSIKVLRARGRYHGVDTPDDVRAVERALRTSS